MSNQDLTGVRFTQGECFTPPNPANENVPVLSPWMTPAEALQLIRRMKDAMRKAFSSDFALRASPKHRQDWDILIGMEKCTLWHCFGVR